MFNLVIDKDSKEFWEGARKNKLMIKKSLKSKKYFLYSLGHSGISASEDYKWVEASGKGIIYSFTVSYVPGGSTYYVDKTPYVIGSILLDEDVRIMSNIISSDFNKIKIGKSVKVEFVKLTEDITFPCFKLI